MTVNKMLVSSNMLPMMIRKMTDCFFNAVKVESRFVLALCISPPAVAASEAARVASSAESSSVVFMFLTSWSSFSLAICASLAACSASLLSPESSAPCRPSVASATKTGSLCSLELALCSAFSAVAAPLTGDAALGVEVGSDVVMKFSQGEAFGLKSLLGLF